MATVGIVAIPVLAVVGAQPAAAATYVPTAYVLNSGNNTVTPVNLTNNSLGTAITVGTSPQGVAFSPDGTKAYVANYSSNSVTPITVATGTAGTAITVGSGPQGVAFSPDGTKAYVTNAGSNSVTPITVATGTAGTAITVGTNPFGVAFSPDGSKAYVANAGSNSVTPITVATGTAGTALTGFTAPYAIAMLANQAPTAVLAQPAAGTVGSTVSFDATGSSDSDGTVASYTFDFGDGTTPVTQAGATITHSYSYGSSVGYAASVKVTDNSGVTSVAKAVKNVAITGTPWAHVAYVANSGANTVSEVNLSASTIWATIPVGSNPKGLAISPDGTKAYVANQGSTTVTPIALATNTPGAPITVGTAPYGVTFTPDGTQAYVTNSGSNTVTPITVATNTPGTAIAVGTLPYAVAFTPDGSKAYVTNFTSGTVTPITVATGTPGTAIAVGTNPYGVAVSPDGTKAYVTNQGSNTVTPITVATNATGTAIAVGATPRMVAFSPDGSTAYVANFGSNTVTPIAVSTGTPGTAITVGSSPFGVAFSSDGVTAYVTNNVSNTVTPITVATSTPGTAIPGFTGPWNIAMVPDQAPTAALAAVTGGAVGATINFDASGSTNPTGGSIASYKWNFGDGTTATTGTATTTHVYAGSYAPGLTASVKVVNSNGTTSVAAATRSVAITGTPALQLAYVANSTANTVSVLNSANDGIIASIAVGSGPYRVAVTPDGSKVYVANYGGGTGTTVSVITTATNTVTVTVTDTAGTSTTQVFTGQSVSRNGKATAAVSRTVVVSTAFSMTTPTTLSFGGALAGADQVISSTLPLDVSNGGAAGWSISATSTTWSTGGGSPHTLPLTATSVTGAPTDTCDAGSACTLASNAVGYPVVIPAGTTAPTATKLFNASALTGTGKQTITPTVKLNVPSNTQSGIYQSTVTVTLSSGP